MACHAISENWPPALRNVSHPVCVILTVIGIIRADNFLTKIEERYCCYLLKLLKIFRSQIDSTVDTDHRIMQNFILNLFFPEAQLV